MHKRIYSLLAATALTSSVALAYNINFDSNATITHDKRSNTSVTMSVDGLPQQTIQVGQQADRLLYHDFSGLTFVAHPGSEINVTFGFTTDWMNGYFYVDTNHDGEFDPETELLTYSNLGGKDSDGNSHNGNKLNPPAFTLPASISEGLYNVRFKIDWSSDDPGGSTAQGNDILKNGGSIVDAQMVVTARHADVRFYDGHSTGSGTIDANGDLNISVSPDDGYAFEGVTLNSGYDLSDVTLVDPAIQLSTRHIAAGAGETSMVIPAHCLTRGYEIFVSTVRPDQIPAEGDYEIRFSNPLAAGETLGALSVNGCSPEFTSAPSRGYFRATAPVNVALGSDFSVSYKGVAGQQVSFFLDRNQDGTFFSAESPISNEKALTVTDGAEFHATLTAPDSPGVYRCRMEVAGNYTADFFINVHKAVASITPMIMNGMALLSDGSLLPETVEIGNRLKLTVTPVLPGFKARGVIVRHGQNLNGPELIKGNPQWSDLELKLTSSGLVSIPGDAINGEVAVYAIFEEQESSEWTKVWGDEFNSSRMDTRRWNYHPRYGATWNRLAAKTTEGRAQVNTFADGCYNSFAAATDLADEESDFITGAIYSQGKFSFKYGKIEARIKTTPHTGNFPAFWMMPATSELRELGMNGWPQDGEIDIWEQVNDENKAHHTVHSGWTGWKAYLQGAGAPPSGPWPAPKQESPSNTGNHTLDAAAWHVIALEWDSEALRWYVDGNLKFTYSNRHYSEEGSAHYFEAVTWPFSKEFYIILNQSVGQQNGWAKAPDKDFVYHTHFDYVRVYQKKGENGFTSTIKNNGDDPSFYVPGTGMLEIETSIDEIAMPELPLGPARLFDLNGRRVSAESVIPGIYVEKRGAQARKIIVR